MKQTALLIILAMLTGLQACYYDVESELYPNETCVTENMSFAQDIQPIFAAQCNACHSTSAPLGNVVLDTWTGTRQQVDAGRLMGAIRHLPGFSAMPQGQAQISACAIEKISAWVAAGAPNN